MTEKVNVVADIGGTNARFALVDGTGVLTSIQIVKCRDFDGPVEAMRSYLSAIENLVSIAGASFSIAATLDGDQVKMTNGPWTFSIKDVQRALNLDKFTVINDFVAKALSIPKLQAEDLLKVGTGKAVPEQSVAILGPGTGLGVSSLIHTADGWMPVGGEGGHVSWAPQDDREIEILRILQSRFGHVSAERLVSGPGLENILAALEKMAGREPTHMTAQDISKAAVAGDTPICVESLNLFCGVLGNVAGNLALSIGAKGGVFIGGGIVRNFLDFIPTSKFREQFENKGRYSAYLKAIPTFVIMVPHTGLIGAAESLKKN